MNSRVSASSVQGPSGPAGSREQGEQRRAQVLELAVGRRGERGEVQVAHRVHELGRHELGVGAVELDRVEAPRALLLGELEQVDPGRLLRRHGVEQAGHGVAVGVDEGEAAPGCAGRRRRGRRARCSCPTRCAPGARRGARTGPSGTSTGRPPSCPIGRSPGPGAACGAASRRLRTTSTGRSSDPAPDSPHSSASAAGPRRIGADRPPTEASTRQPDARSAPTAPTASNSHARRAPAGAPEAVEGRRGREGGSGRPRGGRRRPRRGRRARRPVERGVEEQLAPARPLVGCPVLLVGPRPDRDRPGRRRAARQPGAELDEVGAEVGADARCGLGRLAPDAQPQAARGLARGLERLELGAGIGRGDRGLDHAGELARRLDLEPRPAVDPAQGEGDSPASRSPSATRRAARPGAARRPGAGPPPGRGRPRGRAAAATGRARPRSRGRRRAGAGPGRCADPARSRRRAPAARAPGRRAVARMPCSGSEQFGHGEPPSQGAAAGR